MAKVMLRQLEQGVSAIIELHGPLGAGKTTFTRHLLRALGVEGRIKSPSYAVVEPHESAVAQIHHFDFYRFNDPQEWEDAGFRDVFAAPGLKLVEWPDKAAGLLPRPDLRVVIEPLAQDHRLVRLKAVSPLGQFWLGLLTDSAEEPSFETTAPSVFQGGPAHE
ncbi:MAG TPA: tRNA (adenosine(37)-N6)-threonylcarbamoyltransferase complex ATPase subunit type 1 TsaE [Aquabacterium sp.]|nr:tRNA (adenosine(37)-N6)-threonylcarbamoyltransferase complex ATPase subunit type 1 TsaE [Aquabacterium sp.]